MPCFRCSARQTDPVRGASPWHRAVVSGEQVLVCPACQLSPEWAGTLDRCDRCASTHLTKALGVVLCRDCGARADTGSPASGGAHAEDAPARSVTELTTGELATDVEAALARLFARARPVR